MQGRHTSLGEGAEEVSRKVVDQIAQVATGENDKHVDDVIIESITIEKA